MFVIIAIIAVRIIVIAINSSSQKAMAEEETKGYTMVDSTELGEDGKPLQVPVPDGFTASQVPGETTVNGGFVIYEGEVDWSKIEDLSSYAEVETQELTDKEEENVSTESINLDENTNSNTDSENNNIAENENSTSNIDEEGANTEETKEEQGERRNKKLGEGEKQTQEGNIEEKETAEKELKEESQEEQETVKTNEEKTLNNENARIATKSENSIIKISTGSSEYTKANNIYDIAGNVRDWTLETGRTNARVCRGGYYYYENANSDHAGARWTFSSEPSDNYYSSDTGCRAILLIK